MFGLKKFTVCVLCFSFFICCCMFSDGEIEYIPVTAGVTPTNTVIIDAGHGGFDGGAVASDGTPEKDINLQIALRLCGLLRLHGYEVIMTRTEDTGTEGDPSASISERKKSDMKERLRIINENEDAIFVSIHLNKFTTSAAVGAQVFYSTNHPDSKVLGQSVQQTVKVLVQPENERTIKKGTKSTYLLYNAKIPAVIVECGFLSNSRELELLKTQEYQSKMAFAVFCGIDEYKKNIGV